MRESAKFFSIGWERAYEGRAFGYGPIMPPLEHARMMKAARRMDISFKRENEQRVANGKDALWDGSIQTLIDALERRLSR